MIDYNIAEPLHLIHHWKQQMDLQLLWHEKGGKEKGIPCIGPIMQTSGLDWGVCHHTDWPVTHEWTLTYLGDEWRWDSEPYGEVVSVGWAWRRELKDAGEELPEVVNSEDGDSGLQSQELHEVMSPWSYQAGSMVVIESNKHSTVEAWQRWREGRTDGQSGNGGYWFE